MEKQSKGKPKQASSSSSKPDQKAGGESKKSGKK